MHISLLCSEHKHRFNHASPTFRLIIKKAVFFLEEAMSLLLWPFHVAQRSGGLQNEMNHHNSDIAIECLSAEYLPSGNSGRKATSFNLCQRAGPVSFTTDTKTQRNVKCFSFYRHFRIAELDQTQSLSDEKLVCCQN